MKAFLTDLNDFVNSTRNSGPEYFVHECTVEDVSTTVQSTTLLNYSDLNDRPTVCACRTGKGL